MGGVAAFALPANLVDSVRSDDCAERHDWLRRLPETVGELAGRWSLRPAPPYTSTVTCHMRRPRDAAR